MRKINIILQKVNLLQQLQAQYFEKIGCRLEASGKNMSYLQEHVERVEKQLAMIEEAMGLRGETEENADENCNLPVKY